MDLTYEDERGRIIDVSDMEFHGLQIIESKKGSVRSNHYHKKGGHLLYVISGHMLYEERPVEGGKTKKFIVKTGESIFTGPMIIHRTTFPVNTVMVCCPTLKRTDGGYQDDLVRCEL